MSKHGLPVKGKDWSEFNAHVAEYHLWATPALLSLGEPFISSRTSYVAWSAWFHNQRKTIDTHTVDIGESAA